MAINNKPGNKKMALVTSGRMRIINVIPLSRGVFKETLSYFSSKNIAPGSIATVDIRNRKIDALVVSTEDAARVRSRIRTSSYAIKKLGSIKAKCFFLPAFTEAAKETGDYFATTTGQILQLLTPKQIIAGYDKIKDRRKKTEKYNGTKAAPSEVFVFQADDKERLTTYKSLIREEFARGSSVFFCLPTILDIETTLNSLGKGIGEYTFIMHSGLTKKELIKTWEQIINETHPVLIIATGSFLSIPRRDIGAIILDKENSRNYRTFSRPYFDIRTFVEIFSRKARTRLILGDVFLRPETIWRTNQGELIELSPLKFRALSTAKQNIADMREYKKGGNKKNFSFLSDEVKILIENNKENNENLFVLMGRRGLSPVTICNDCGELMQCKNCKTPMVLHKGSGGNIFLCHKCGEQKHSEQRCGKCNSWRLVALGIGIEKIHEEIKRQFPDIKIFQIDSDSVKTHKKGVDVIENFFSSPGSILLGTEMAIPYINKDLDSSAALGIDSLFTVPDFRMSEKIFNTLLTLRIKTLKNFLIQTRNPEENVFEYVTKGNLLDFYRNEIKQRKKFGYPPFSVLIKITYHGKKHVAIKEMEKLSDILRDYGPSIYPAFVPNARSVYSVNALIKLEGGKWVDENLLEILRALPPSFTVQVDPADLL